MRAVEEVPSREIPAALPLSSLGTEASSEKRASRHSSTLPPPPPPSCTRERGERRRRGERGRQGAVGVSKRFSFFLKTLSEPRGHWCVAQREKKAESNWEGCSLGHC